MTVRGLGLLSVLLGFALAAGLWALNAQQSGPTSKPAQRIETQAQQAVAGVNFSQATVQLELWKSENGTYSGASLPASFGVTLMRADGTSYCMQAGVGTSVQHENGPGGSPAAGRC